MRRGIIAIAAVAFVLALSIGACATTESEPAQSGDVYTLYLAPELVDCVGVAPQKCMLVKRNPSDEYTLMYDQIDGFDFEPGYEYELIVEETEVENPPADASSIKLTLVEMVNKTPVSE